MAQDELVAAARAYAEKKTEANKAIAVSLARSYIESIVARLSLSNPTPSVLDKDDLVQCGYIAFLSVLESWRPSVNPNFKAYAYRRILGAAQDAIRAASSTSRSRSVEFQSVHNLLVEPGNPDREYDIIEYEISVPSAIMDAILRLPLRECVIMMFSLHGLTSKQIAKALAISPTRVAQHRKASLTQMRTELSRTLPDAMRNLT